VTHRHRRPRDPVAVRTAVLDAALELFATHGYADTSLRDISQKSGVAHPLILHHFGSKESLFSEVKRRVVEGYARRFPTAAGAVTRPINLRTELQRIMTYVGENELALRLCARTRVDGDYQVWPGEPNLFDLLEKRMKVAQEQGLFRDDLDARQLSIMIMGIVFFWLENRRHFAARFGKPIDSRAYLKTAVKMIEEGLRPRTS
jgi:TetR/AcrR family transcriptional regulator